jgi:hypothetical protein
MELRAKTGLKPRFIRSLPTLLGRVADFKKPFGILLVLAASLIIPARVSAVWPPSTSLEGESPAPSASGSEEMTLKVTPSSTAVIDKLEADERRLQNILQDLLEDERALKQLGGTPRDYRRTNDVSTGQ